MTTGLKLVLGVGGGMEPESADPPVAERVGERLDARGETLAAAESCTGGLVGSLVTDVPGASAHFDRSYVTYTYGAKRALLGVTEAALAEDGAVSDRVGRQMAEGALADADTDWAVSTTGVAGPERDRTGEPVGTVYVAVARDGTATTAVERYRFEGVRTEVKTKVARQALWDLLGHVEDAD